MTTHKAMSVGNYMGVCLYRSNNYLFNIMKKTNNSSSSVAFKAITSSSQQNYHQTHVVTS